MDMWYQSVPTDTKMGANKRPCKNPKWLGGLDANTVFKPSPPRQDAQ